VHGKDARHHRPIRNIGLDEGHSAVGERSRQAEEAPGIGELVDDDERVGGACESVLNEIRSDEARATGDQQTAQTAAPSGY
jgi:hypothetical protein